MRGRSINLTLKLFPYLELVSSNDHHKPHNTKPRFNNHSRNTFMIRNQNKRRSSLYLVAKLKNFDVNLLLWRIVAIVSLYKLGDSFGKRI